MHKVFPNNVVWFCKYDGLTGTSHCAMLSVLIINYLILFASGGRDFRFHPMWVEQGLPAQQVNNALNILTSKPPSCLVLQNFKILLTFND